MDLDSDSEVNTDSEPRSIVLDFIPDGDVYNQLSDEEKSLLSVLQYLYSYLKEYDYVEGARDIGDNMEVLTKLYPSICFFNDLVRASFGSGLIVASKIQPETKINLFDEKYREEIAIPKENVKSWNLFKMSYFQKNASQTSNESKDVDAVQSFDSLVEYVEKNEKIPNILPILDILISWIQSVDSNPRFKQDSVVAFSYFRDVLWTISFKMTSPIDDSVKSFLWKLVQILFFTDLVRNILYFGLSMFYRRDGISGFLSNFTERLAHESVFAIFGKLTPEQMFDSISHLSAFYMNLVYFEQYAYRITEFHNNFASLIYPDNNNNIIHNSERNLFDAFIWWKTCLLFDDELEERIFNTSDPASGEPQQGIRFMLSKITKYPELLLLFDNDNISNSPDEIEALYNDAEVVKPRPPFQMLIINNLYVNNLNTKEHGIHILINENIWLYDELVDKYLIEILAGLTYKKLTKTNYKDEYKYLTNGVSPEMIITNDESPLQSTLNKSLQSDLITKYEQTTSSKYPRQIKSFRYGIDYLDRIFKDTIDSYWFDKQIDSVDNIIPNLQIPLLNDGIYYSKKKDMPNEYEICDEIGLTLLVEKNEIDWFGYLVFVPLKYSSSINSGEGRDSRFYDGNTQNFVIVIDYILQSLFQPFLSLYSDMDIKIENETVMKEKITKAAKIVQIMKTLNPKVDYEVTLIPVLDSVISGDNDKEIYQHYFFDSEYKAELISKGTPIITIYNNPSLFKSDTIKFFYESSERFTNDMMPNFSYSKNNTHGTVVDSLFKKIINHTNEELESQQPTKNWTTSGSGIPPFSGAQLNFVKRVIKDDLSVDKLKEEEENRKIFYPRIFGSKKRTQSLNNPKRGNPILPAVQLDVSFNSVKYEQFKDGSYGEDIKKVIPRVGSLLKFEKIDSKEKYLDHGYRILYNPFGFTESSQENPFFDDEKNTDESVNNANFEPILIGHFQNWVWFDSNQKSRYNMQVIIQKDSLNTVFGIGTIMSLLSNFSLAPNELGLFDSLNNSLYVPEKGLIKAQTEMRKLKDRNLIQCNRETWDLLLGEKTESVKNLLSTYTKNNDQNHEFFPFYQLNSTKEEYRQPWKDFKASLQNRFNLSIQKGVNSFGHQLNIYPKGFEATYPLKDPLFLNREFHDSHRLFFDSVIYERSNYLAIDFYNRVDDDLLPTFFDSELYPQEWKDNYLLLSKYLERNYHEALLADLFKSQIIPYQPVSLFYPGLYTETRKLSEAKSEYRNLLFDSKFFEGSDKKKKMLGKLFGWLPVSFYDLKQQLVGWSANTESQKFSNSVYDSMNYKPKENDEQEEEEEEEEEETITVKQSIKGRLLSETYVGSVETQLWTKPVLTAESLNPKNLNIKSHFACHLNDNSPSTKPSEFSNDKSKADFFREIVTSSVSMNPACIPMPIARGMDHTTLDWHENPITNGILKQHRIMMNGGIENDDQLNRFMDVNCEAYSNDELDLRHNWSKTLNSNRSLYDLKNLPETFIAPICNRVVNIGTTNINLVARILPKNFFDIKQNIYPPLPIMGCHNIDKIVDPKQSHQAWSLPTNSENKSLIIEWQNDSEPDDNRSGTIRIPKNGVLVIQKISDNLPSPGLPATEIPPAEDKLNLGQRDYWKRGKIFNMLDMDSLDIQLSNLGPKEIQLLDKYYPSYSLKTTTVINNNNENIDYFNPNSVKELVEISPEVQTLIDLAQLKFSSPDKSYLNTPYHLTSGIHVNGTPDLQLDIIRNFNVALSTKYLLDKCFNLGREWFLKQFENEKDSLKPLLDHLQTIIRKSVNNSKFPILFNENIPKYSKFLANDAGVLSDIYYQIPDKSIINIINETSDQIMKRPFNEARALINSILKKIIDTKGKFIKENSTLSSSSFSWRLRRFSPSGQPSLFEFKIIDSSKLHILIQSRSINQRLYQLFGSNNNNFNDRPDMEVMGDKKENLLNESDKNQLIQVAFSLNGLFDRLEHLQFIELLSVYSKFPNPNPSKPRFFVIGNNPLLISLLIRLNGIDVVACQTFGIEHVDNQLLNKVDNYLEGNEKIIHYLFDLFKSGGSFFAQQYEKKEIKDEIILDASLSEFSWYLLQDDKMDEIYNELSKTRSSSFSITEWASISNPVNCIKLLLHNESLLILNEIRTKVTNGNGIKLLTNLSSNKPKKSSYKINLTIKPKFKEKATTGENDIFFETHAIQIDLVGAGPNVESPIEKDNYYWLNLESKEFGLDGGDSQIKTLKNINSSFRVMKPELQGIFTKTKPKLGQFYNSMRILSNTITPVTTNDDNNNEEPNLTNPFVLNFKSIESNDFADFLSNSNNVVSINSIYLKMSLSDGKIINNAIQQIDLVLEHANLKSAPLEQQQLHSIFHYMKESQFIYIDLSDQKNVQNWDVTIHEMDYLILAILNLVFYNAFIRWLSYVKTLLNNIKAQKTEIFLQYTYDQIISQSLTKHLFNLVQGILFTTSSVHFGWNTVQYEHHLSQVVIPNFMKNIQILVIKFLDRILKPECLALISFMDYQLYLFDKISNRYPNKNTKDLLSKLDYLIEQLKIDDDTISNWSKDIDTYKNNYRGNTPKEIYRGHDKLFVSNYKMIESNNDDFIISLKKVYIDGIMIRSKDSFIQKLGEIKFLIQYFPQVCQHIWKQIISSNDVKWWKNFREIVYRYFPLPIDNNQDMFDTLDLSLPYNLNTIFTLCNNNMTGFFKILEYNRSYHPGLDPVGVLKTDDNRSNNNDSKLALHVSPSIITDETKLKNSFDKIFESITNKKDDTLVFPGIATYDFEKPSLNWKFIGVGVEDSSQKVPNYIIRFSPIAINSLAAIGSNHILLLWQEGNENTKLVKRIETSRFNHNRIKMGETVTISNPKTLNRNFISKNIEYTRIDNRWDIKFNTTLKNYDWVKNLYEDTKVYTTRLIQKSRFGLVITNQNINMLCEYILRSASALEVFNLTDNISPSSGGFRVPHQVLDYYFNLLQGFSNIRFLNMGIILFDSLFYRISKFKDQTSMISFIKNIDPNKVKKFIFPLYNDNGTGWEIYIAYKDEKTLFRYTFNDKMDNGPDELPFIQSFFRLLYKDNQEKWQVVVNRWDGKSNVKLSFSPSVPLDPNDFIGLSAIMVCAMANTFLFNARLSGTTQFFIHDNIIKHKMFLNQVDDPTFRRIIHNYLHFWVLEIVYSIFRNSISVCKSVNLVPKILLRSQQPQGNAENKLNEMISKQLLLDTERKSDILIEGGLYRNIDHSVEHFKSLLNIKGSAGPTGWLNEASINIYVGLLMQYAIYHNLPYFICETTLYTTGIDKKTKKFNFELIRQSKTYLELLQNFDKDFHRTVFVPIYSIERQHFTLGVIHSYDNGDSSSRKKIIATYDPLFKNQTMKSENSKANVLDRENLRLFANVLFPSPLNDLSSYSMIDNPTLTKKLSFPTQTDSISCGVLLLVMLNLLITGRNKTLLDLKTAIMDVPSVNDLGISFDIPDSSKNDILKRLRYIIAGNIFNHTLTIIDFINPSALEESKKEISSTVSSKIIEPPQIIYPVTPSKLNQSFSTPSTPSNQSFSFGEGSVLSFTPNSQPVNPSSLLLAAIPVMEFDKPAILNKSLSLQSNSPNKFATSPQSPIRVSPVIQTRSSPNGKTTSGQIDLFSGQSAIDYLNTQGALNDNMNNNSYSDNFQNTKLYSDEVDATYYSLLNGDNFIPDIDVHFDNFDGGSFLSDNINNAFSQVTNDQLRPSSEPTFPITNLDNKSSVREKNIPVQTTRADSNVQPGMSPYQPNDLPIDPAKSALKTMTTTPKAIPPKKLVFVSTPSSSNTSSPGVITNTPQIFGANKPSSNTPDVVTKTVRIFDKSKPSSSTPNPNLIANTTQIFGTSKPNSLLHNNDSNTNLFISTESPIKAQKTPSFKRLLNQKTISVSDILSYDNNNNDDINNTNTSPIGPPISTPSSAIGDTFIESNDNDSRSNSVGKKIEVNQKSGSTFSIVDHKSLINQLSRIPGYVPTDQYRVNIVKKAIQDIDENNPKIRFKNAVENVRGWLNNGGATTIFFKNFNFNELRDIYNVYHYLEYMKSDIIIRPIYPKGADMTTNGTFFLNDSGHWSDFFDKADNDGRGWKEILDQFPSNEKNSMNLIRNSIIKFLPRAIKYEDYGNQGQRNIFKDNPKRKWDDNNEEQNRLARLTMKNLGGLLPNGSTKVTGFAVIVRWIIIYILIRHGIITINDSENREIIVNFKMNDEPDIVNPQQTSSTRSAEEQRKYGKGVKTIPGYTPGRPKATPGKTISTPGKPQAKNTNETPSRTNKTAKEVDSEGEDQYISSGEEEEEEEEKTESSSEQDNTNTKEAQAKPIDIRLDSYFGDLLTVEPEIDENYTKLFKDLRIRFIEGDKSKASIEIDEEKYAWFGSFLDDKNLSYTGISDPKKYYPKTKDEVDKNVLKQRNKIIHLYPNFTVGQLRFLIWEVNWINELFQERSIREIFEEVVKKQIIINTKQSTQKQKKKFDLLKYWEFIVEAETRDNVDAGYRTAALLPPQKVSKTILNNYRISKVTGKTKQGNVDNDVPGIEQCKSFLLFIFSWGSIIPSETSTATVKKKKRKQSSE